MIYYVVHCYGFVAPSAVKTFNTLAAAKRHGRKLLHLYGVSGNYVQILMLNRIHFNGSSTAYSKYVSRLAMTTQADGTLFAGTWVAINGD